MKFQLHYVLFVETAVSYGQVPAKGREIQKRLKRKISPGTQRLKSSRTFGNQLGLANSPLCDREHMAFTIKKVLGKTYHTGNIKPQVNSSGEGQRAES